MQSLYKRLGKAKAKGLVRTGCIQQKRYITRRHIVQQYGLDSVDHYYNPERHITPEKVYDDLDSMEQDLKAILSADIPLNTLREIGKRELKGRELTLWEQHVNKLERKLEWASLELARDLKSHIFPDVKQPLQFPDWVTAIEFLLNAAHYYQVEERSFYFRSKAFSSPLEKIEQRKLSVESLFEEFDENGDPTSIMDHPRFSLGDSAKDLVESGREERREHSVRLAPLWLRLRDQNTVPCLTEKYSSNIQYLLKKIPELRIIVKDFSNLITGVSEGYKNIDEMIDAISHYSQDGHFNSIEGINISFLYHMIQVHNKLAKSRNEMLVEEHKKIMKYFCLLPKQGIRYRHVRSLFANVRKSTFSMTEKEGILNSLKVLLENHQDLRKDVIYHINEIVRIIRSGRLGDDTLTIIDGSIDTYDLPETPDYWRRHSDRTALTWEILTKYEKINDKYAEERVDYLTTPRILLHFDEIAASGDIQLMKEQLEKAGLLEIQGVSNTVGEMMYVKQKVEEAKKSELESQKKKRGLESREINGERILAYRTKKGDVYAANVTLYEQKKQLKKTIYKQDVEHEVSKNKDLDMDTVLSQFGITEEEMDIETSKNFRNESNEEAAKFAIDELTKSGFLTDTFLDKFNVKTNATPKDLEDEIASKTDPFPPLGENWEIRFPNEAGCHHWFDYLMEIESKPEFCRLTIEMSPGTYTHKDVVDVTVERLLIIDFDKSTVTLSEKTVKQEPIEKNYEAYAETNIKSMNILYDHKAKKASPLSGDNQMTQLNRLDMAMSMDSNSLDIIMDEIPEFRQRSFKIPTNLVLSLKKVLWPNNQDYRVLHTELPTGNEFLNTSESHLNLAQRKRELATRVFQLFGQ